MSVGSEVLIVFAPVTLFGFTIENKETGGQVLTFCRKQASSKILDTCT